MGKAFIVSFAAVCIAGMLVGCNSHEKVHDEKLDYFSTTDFTLDSFISAVKKYGTEGKVLSDAQCSASYSNESIKKLLTSKNYDIMSEEEISVGGLWNVMYKDIFSKEVTYTLNGFFETVRDKCVCSSSNVSCVYFIGGPEEYMAGNDSIVSLCKNDGFGVYSKFESGYELYKSDLIDLYMKTNTWINNNANIACNRTYSGYYPFAFEASFWDGKDFKYENNGYSFGDTSTYVKLVDTVKSHLRDPSSYEPNGNIEFYSTSGEPVSNGYYTGSVYVKVPFRAKNGFGGYGTDIVWLKYNWNVQSFSWYSEYTPTSINTFPFNTGYLN